MKAKITSEDLFKSLVYHCSLCEAREVSVENIFTPDEIKKSLDLIKAFIGLTHKKYRGVFKKHKRNLNALLVRGIPIDVLSTAFKKFGVNINEV